MLKKLIHYLIVGLLAVMFIVLIISLFNPDFLKPIIDWIKTSIEHLGKWNYLLAFMSALVESLPILGTIFPGQVIMMSVGGFYGGQGYEQFIWVALCAISGSILSNAIGYFLWRYYGEEFFKKYGLWVGIQETELRYLKKWVETWGAWGIILSKFHASLRAFLPFIAWSMGLSQKKFWIYNIIGSTLWAFTFILIGIFFAQYYEKILEYFGWIFMWVMIIWMGYIYLFRREQFMKYLQEKNHDLEKRQEEKHKKKELIR